MAGKTSTYYKKNPKAAARRRKQQRAYNKTAKGLMIRTAANKLNRKLGTYGESRWLGCFSHRGRTKVNSKNHPRIEHVKENTHDAPVPKS